MPARASRGRSGAPMSTTAASYRTWTINELRKQLSNLGFVAPAWMKKSGLIRELLRRNNDQPDDVGAQRTGVRAGSRARPARRRPTTVPGIDNIDQLPVSVRPATPTVNEEVMSVLQELRGAIANLDRRCDATAAAITRLETGRNPAATRQTITDPQPGHRPLQETPTNQPIGVGDSPPADHVTGISPAPASDVAGNTPPNSEIPGASPASRGRNTAGTHQNIGHAAVNSIPAWAFTDTTRPLASGAALGEPRTAFYGAVGQAAYGPPGSAGPTNGSVHNVPMLPVPGPGQDSPMAALLGGGAGIRSDCAPKVELVSDQLRKDVVTGKDVNLAAFLIHDHEYEEGTRSILADGTAIPLKPLSDPRLHRSLTIQEFIEAFTIFKNVMCEAYPNRRFELDCYERDLVDMSNRFGGLRFYDYHKAFSAKAAALLRQRHLKVDWSHRDQNLFNEIFAGHKTNACQICDSSAHTANLCPQTLPQAKPSTTPNPATDHSPNPRRLAVKRPFPRGPPPQETDFQGRPRRRLPEFCNNFNDSSCNRSPCPFLHYCASCWLPGHPQHLCRKLTADQPPQTATAPSPASATRAPPARQGPAAQPNLARKTIKWLAPAPGSPSDASVHASLPNYQAPPINLNQLELELAKFPDLPAKQALLEGLTHGFDTGFSSLPSENYHCKNLLSARSDPDTVSQLLNLELSRGYLIGPFAHPPFHTYRINPLGLAEKKYSGKKRLTVDLSAPHNVPGHTSLNDLIDKADFSLSYVKLDDAIALINTLGPHVLMCKTDITDAFKQVPIHPSLWAFHGIHWEEKFYFFTRLVFGSRSSPKIFDTLSSALNWIAIQNYNLPHTLHLLDDFLCILPPGMNGNAAMARLKHMFKVLNIPLSEPKTLGPAPILEYLGITLDTLAMEARLPPDKLTRITALVNNFLGRTKSTQGELLSLIGHLGFAARVIPAGRTFMSRLFTAAYTVEALHHRVYISAECRKDLLMWHQLLRHWNGVSLFLETKATSANSLDLYTDASGTLGFGGYFKGKWFYGTWPPEVQKSTSADDDFSIAFKELYPIVVAAMLWGSSWRRKRIVFHTDNQATCHILNKGRSKCPIIMKLMRRLVITASLTNFAFSAEYIPGHLNTIADSLSRLQIKKFRSIAPQAEPQPCQLPSPVMFS